MAGYKLLVLPSVVKDCRKIPAKDKGRILRRIESLADDPRQPGSVKLSGGEKYRLRQGDYRILYRIEDEYMIVVVVKVAHRKDVYR